MADMSNEIYSPLFWDADPDVCCAAYQLGACHHTEDFDQEDIDAANIELLVAALAAKTGESAEGILDEATAKVFKKHKVAAR